MPQFLARNVVHLVFSTKFRAFLQERGIEWDERHVWD
jgi:hypothetical protein